MLLFAILVMANVITAKSHLLGLCSSVTLHINIGDFAVLFDGQFNCRGPSYRLCTPTTSHINVV